MMKITCGNCGKECDKPAKEINRHLNQGRTVFYCSLTCSTQNTKTTTKTIKSSCLFCGKEIQTTTHKKHKKCCSKQCSAKYAKTFVDKDKISESIKKLWDNGVYGDRFLPIPRLFKCVVCGITFNKVIDNWTYKTHPPKTCSDECYKKRLSKLARENPNCGGETNYRKYIYDNVWMDSKWEVEMAKWFDENKIEWDRSKKRHQFFWTDENGLKRRYYPDFYLPQYKVYVDTKNPYLMKCDEYKINQVVKENKVKIFCGSVDEIKKMLTQSLNSNILILDA